ncbi:MAG: secretin N-terminal domain-containing protein [Candidatus Omnitrophota bacterium]
MKRLFTLAIFFFLFFVCQSLNIRLKPALLPALFFPCDEGFQAACFAKELPLSAEDNYAQLPVNQAAPINYPEASQAVIQPLAKGLESRISLDLRNIDVVDALKFLSLKAGLNIITTKSVTGRVTLMVEEACVKDIFDVMLRSNNLAYDKQGDIYNVMTQEEYRKIYGIDFGDVREVSVFRLKYAIPEQAFNVLDILKSDIGRVLVDPDSGHAVIMDSPEKIKLMREALERFEDKNLVQVFKLNYAKAKDIEDQLRTQLDFKKVGLVKADERSNQVIVQALPERMKDVNKLIASLDEKTKQVLIDARIVKVKLSDELTAGVEWEGLFNLGKKYGLTYLGSSPFSAVQATTDAWRSRQQVYEDVGYVGSYPFSGTSTSYSSGAQSIGSEEMHLGVVGKHDFDIIIKYLQTLGDTRVLSNPKLAVVNNQEAKIHVGEEIPYVVTTTVGAGESTSSVAEDVQYEEIGIMLSVVPDINDEGYVTLKVKSEISSLLEYYITPTGNKIPIKETATAETTVMVKEKSTIIIGGLRKEQDTDTSSRVPFLSRIPFLGKLFSMSTKNKTRTELLIILTPTLISGDVLVTGVQGGDIDQLPVKSAKDYSELKSEVFIPLDDDDSKGLFHKGFKPRNE